ncbi:MAG: class I SAM-dependent methyltransferase [Candidatus Moranbacteria bacterium]|nr:class I SAM-dependent methyltransferase [Candidatus Moranbacteria bacterium]
MKCIICGNSDHQKLFEGIVKCSGCGLVFFDQDLSEDEIKKLYKEGYFKGEEYCDYEEDKNILQKNFTSRLKDILRYKKQGNLFEIGSAYGYFLEKAKKYFDVEGIDITEKPTAFARNKLGLNVHTGNYLDFEISEKKDLFCMWDTIEHLREPQKFIEKISRDIKTGGYLFLTTGDIGSLVPKMQGRKWRLIHPPTHLYYFSRDTIKKLLEQKGFEVLEIKHPGFHRSLSQIIYALLYLKRRKNSEKAKKILKLIDFPLYLNTFDIMHVIARKK